MKGTVLGLLFLSFFMAVYEVKSEGSPIKLCGREFVRAVIFTCGGSRWRRELTDLMENLIDQGSHPRFLLDINDSTGAKENYIRNTDIQSQGFIQSMSETEKDLQRKSVHMRQEDIVRISVSCCAVGCSESTIHSLC
ncbi:Relaxin-3 [Varanus komodoensis]|uniref:insulin-like peptide INSL5 n=1 Tax=Varanus komodoensis TaxID=61221 RepID=UPI001CF7D0FA|nr:insulin-like peptide INSL5 [Varanus komodoensis]KAF7253982.1 Relaxin-3 [Varanus komodoensis]